MCFRTSVEEAEWRNVLFLMNVNELEWIMSRELLSTYSVLELGV